MTDVQWVFDRAIHLMDEQDEDTGKTETQDTREYKLRALSILNVMRSELAPLSMRYGVSENGTRPLPDMILDFKDEIGLDDDICQGIMPYGLAALLLLGEDSTKASFFNQKYEELKARHSAKSSAVWEDIPYDFM